MPIISYSRLSAIAMAAMGSAVISTAASAQSLTPMRAEISSVSDRFAIRVFPSNPYSYRIPIEVHVYDENFEPVEAIVRPAVTLVAPEDNRSVLVVVPFDGRQTRKVRICAESVPVTGTATIIRTRVCGKYLARHM